MVFVTLEFASWKKKNPPISSAQAMEDTTIMNRPGMPWQCWITPEQRRNTDWGERKKDFHRKLMQALTFQELAELRFLFQSGLEVEELPVAAVHSVVGHLLKAARAVTLQGCLVLRRKATVINPYPKTILIYCVRCWPHNPQTPGSSRPIISQDWPFPA